MEIGYVVTFLNTNIYKRLTNKQTIRDFFDEDNNDYFFNTTEFADRKNRLENLIKKLLELQGITAGENYTKVMSFFLNTGDEKPLKFKTLYNISKTYNVRLMSIFDRDVGERGSLTKPSKNTKTLKGFISTNYLKKFNDTGNKNTYTGSLGPLITPKKEFYREIYKDYLTILNGSIRGISDDNKHYTINIRRICTIIFDLIVARAFRDIHIDSKKQILNEAETNIFDTKGDDYLKNEYILEIFFKKFLEFKQKRNDSISNLGLELYNTSIPKGTTSIPIKSICLFQEVNEDYKKKFEEQEVRSNYKIHIEPKKLHDNNILIDELTSIHKEANLKNSSSSVILCDSISEKNVLYWNQVYLGFRNSNGTPTPKIFNTEEHKNAPDIVFANITIEGEKFLIVSIHTSTDGKSAIDQLEKILKIFKEDNDSQHLIIGMDTNAKKEDQRKALVDFCYQNNRLKIAGFPYANDVIDYLETKPCIPFLKKTDIDLNDYNRNFNLRYKQEIITSYTGCTVSRTYIQTQINKGNHILPSNNPQFNNPSKKIYDFIFFKSKGESKLVSEEHQLNKILEVYDPLTLPFNYADHRPVKYRLKLIDNQKILKCYIDVTTFNMSGPNTNFFEYPLDVMKYRKKNPGMVDLTEELNIVDFVKYQIQEHKKFNLLISQTVFNLEALFKEEEKIEIKKGPIKTLVSLIKKIKIAGQKTYEPYDILRYQIILQKENFGKQLKTCIEFLENHNFKLTNKGTQKNKFCVPNMYVGLNLIFQYTVSEGQNIYFEVQFHTCETYKLITSQAQRRNYEIFKNKYNNNEKKQAEKNMLRASCLLKKDIKDVDKQIQQLVNENPSWLPLGMDLSCRVMEGKECSNLKGGYRKTKRNRKYSQKRKKPLRNKKSKKSRNRKKYSRKK